MSQKSLFALLSYAYRWETTASDEGMTPAEVTVSLSVKQILKAAGVNHSDCTDVRIY